MNVSLTKIKVEMQTNLLNLATKADLAETKAELLKWMFIFWAGQAATTIGVVPVVISKLR